MTALFEQVKKDKDKPTYQNPVINGQHQIDTLYWPYKNENNYKYLLVVCDIHTRLIDAEPMKNRDSLIVANCLEKIYKRSILSKPIELICDDGSEFKGDFINFCKKYNIFLKNKH